MVTTLYLRGHWPTPPERRLSFVQLAGVLFDAGWQNEPMSELVTATAVARAESGLDPVAYLAYLQVPGNPAGSAWQRKVYANNVAWLRAQTNAVTVENLPALLATRPLAGKLPHRRIVLPKTTEGRPRVDYGLLQLNSTYYPLLAQPYENAAFAYEHIYKGRGRTFNAWAAYTGGSYRKFLGPAREAVRQVTG